MDLSGLIVVMVRYFTNVKTRLDCRQCLSYNECCCNFFFEKYIVSIVDIVFPFIIRNKETYFRIETRFTICDLLLLLFLDG